MPTSLALNPRYVLWPAPEPQRADRPLLVLMHGWSYDGRHPFAFAHLFPGEMVVASVRAPYAEAGGYAWFPSRGNRIGNPPPRVANDAAEAVLGWLDILPLAPSTGLLGFSHGGAIVLQLARQAGRGSHPGRQRRQASTGTAPGNEGISPAHWPPHTGAAPFTAKAH